MSVRGETKTASKKVRSTVPLYLSQNLYGLAWDCAHRTELWHSPVCGMCPFLFCDEKSITENHEN
jgi:hypothetical protein